MCFILIVLVFGFVIVVKSNRDVTGDGLSCGESPSEWIVNWFFCELN